jgi:hypothetical protein
VTAQWKDVALLSLTGAAALIVGLKIRKRPYDPNSVDDVVARTIKYGAVIAGSGALIGAARVAAALLHWF